VNNLLALHIDVYEQLWALDTAIANLSTKEMKPVVIESFNNLMSEIEGRMAMVVETLMEGLKESYKRQEEGAPPPSGTDAITPIVTSQVDRFLQARIGIGECLPSLPPSPPPSLPPFPISPFTSNIPLSARFPLRPSHSTIILSH